ncbi:MAG TPA: type II secretion system protein, partial [Candidatus Sulfopaludibacter sp.]|nr:type II secretion system protein [Candidatus Sulfopaludibacter sp.]
RELVRRSERGVTLLELMIAITLVAGLSTGMLMAMRTSLLTYEKTAKRLESNRRFVKTQQMLSDQISAVMPVQGACLGDDGQPLGIPSFLSGSEDTLRLVSSYSIAEGARGYPQIVEYQVIAEPRGSVQLVATESPYTGPQSTIPFCGPAPPPPVSSFELGAGSAVPLGGTQAAASSGASYVLAEHLAYCRFSYHEPYNQNRFIETPWLPLWDKPLLPAGVRIEMRSAVPDTGGLSVLGVTVPIQVNRDPRMIYVDGF